MVVRIHGLSHISLAVRDPQRSLDFYAAMLGVREYYRDCDQIQAHGPGPFDVLAFEKNPERAAYVADPDGYEIELWFE